MKKIAVMVLSALLAVTMFTGCGSSGENVSIKVAMIDGAPLLTMAKMRTDDFSVKNGYDIAYSTYSDSDTLVASLMNKELDFAIAPINIASLMHNNGSGYRLAAVTIWGIMHIVSNQNISSLEELKGEVIFAYAKSGTPGITLRAVLEQNRVDTGVDYVEYSGTVDSNKINIAYLTAPSDVKDAIVAGTFDGITVKFGLLAEPVATAISGATGGRFSAKINLQTEWAKKYGEIYPQAALIFHERLLEKDSDFVDKFIAMAELSSMYAQSNPKIAGDMAVALGSKAIPNGTIVQNAMNADPTRLPLDFTYALDAKSAVTAYLEVLFAASPTLIGGSMPSDSFYYGAA